MTQDNLPLFNHVFPSILKDRVNIDYCTSSEEDFVCEKLYMYNISSITASDIAAEIRSYTVEVLDESIKKVIV